MLVATIIVTYNGSEWIEKCLKSIDQNYAFDHVIYVVDNGSTDNTKKLVSNQFKNVQLISSPENLGFGQANNLGIRKAVEGGCDYCFLLNQDAWVENETLSRLVGIAENHPRFGIVSPMHMNGSQNAFDHGFAEHISKGQNHIPLLYDYTQKNGLKQIYEVDFVNAAAWLVSNKCLRDVGGFDPLFFHYAEDDDYANRVLFHGLKIGICPETQIFHDRTPSSTPISSVIYLKRMFYVECSNINQSFNLAFVKYFKLFAAMITKSLFRFRFIEVCSFLKNWTPALIGSSRVRKNRKKTSTSPQTPYLYIQD